MQTKLLKWSAFRPHFPQNGRKVPMKLWKREKKVSMRLRTRVRAELIPIKSKINVHNNHHKNIPTLVAKV